MALGIVQVIIKGTAAGQEIRNILYFGGPAGETVEIVSSVQLAAFLFAFGEAFDGVWGLGLANSYNAYELEAKVLDIRGVVADFPPEILPVDWDGLRSDATDTQGLYAVINMKNTAVGSEGARSLRRSYLAYGPLVNLDVGADGALQAALISEVNSLLPVLDDVVSDGVNEYWPVRLGRTKDPDIPALGLVSVAILRPYASFRRSRLRRPTG